MVLVTPSPDGGEVTPDGTKKKKLTTIEKSDGRRLVEYLVVVSSVPRPSEEVNPNGQEMNLSTSFDDENVEFIHGFKPEITARYPLYDHEDNPLHENVTFFCHPSGSIHLKAESHMPKVRKHLVIPLGFCYQTFWMLYGSLFLSLTLSSKHTDSLFRCNRRDWFQNVWYMFDIMGTLQNFRKSQKGRERYTRRES